MVRLPPSSVLLGRPPAVAGPAPTNQIPPHKGQVGTLLEAEAEAEAVVGLGGPGPAGTPWLLL